MLQHLAVPFADVSASSLSWRDDEVPEGVAELRVVQGDVELELRLLGSSHAALLREGGREHREVVACAPEGGDPAEPLPEELVRELPGGLEYRFRSSTAHVPDGLTALADALRTRFSSWESALVGAFPGDDAALTVMVAGSPGRWRTWHLYPGSREVVRTATSVVRVRRA